MTRLFVDGAAGTVGSAIQPYLAQLRARGMLTEIIELADDVRKDVAARKDAMAAADIVLLCLPDQLAEEAASLAQTVNPALRLLDASAAHRCKSDWVYGMPELVPEAAIRKAQFVANPGCFATGCILLANPLRALLAVHLPCNPALSKLPGSRLLPWVPFQGITGVSAAGRVVAQGPDAAYLTQLGKMHRHVPEIERFGGVSPAMTVMLGNWFKGMLVQATLPLRAEEVLETYTQAYRHQPGIEVVFAGDENRRFSAEVNNDTNQVTIMVSPQPYGVTVAAAFDNLGKGSAGAAAHNLALMLTH